MALPLDRSLLELLAGDALAAERPGVVSLFLPRGRPPSAGRARSSRRSSPRRGWRSSPGGPCPSTCAALGAAAAASRPSFEQAIVGRPTRAADDPRPITDDAFERRLVVARRRLETAARSAGGALAELAVPSASARTIVYKGLVIGGRLPDLYPDLRAPLSLDYAVFHQRYATNTHPVWRLAQPFRSIAHNGEINTVRGNREQVRGRAADAAGSAMARELLAAGQLLSADGSDSLSLDEALELLTTTGWELTPALLTAIPEALALRRAPHPHVATLRRRTAGLLAPWDGPAAIVFADGRHVGALVDRNGLRPAAFAVTRDRLVAVASETGAVPFTAAETVRRGRLGPGELLLVEPRRRAILEDAEAKARALRDVPDPRRCRGRSLEDRGSRSPRLDARPRARTTSCATSPVSTRSAPGSTSRRWRSRATNRSGAWATTRRRPVAAGSTAPSPTTCARRSPRSPTRPSTPSESGSSWTCGWSSVAGRPSWVGRRAGHGPFACRARSSWISTGSSPRSARPGATVRTLDATWDPASGPAGLEAALERLGTEAVAASRRGAGLVVVSDAAWSIDRLPVPSILATGAVHTALTDAGLRGRTDVAVSAADILDVHAMAMVLAVGATAVHPRLAIELAAELAGTRGAEAMTPAETVLGLVAAFEAGLRKTLARMGISAVASYIGGALIDVVDLDASVVARCFPTAAAWPGRTTLADLAERQIRRRDAALAIPEPAAGREPRLPDPGFARFRADGEAHLFSPRIAGRDPGPVRARRDRTDATHRRRRRRPGPLSRRARPSGRGALRAARRAPGPDRGRAGSRWPRSRTRRAIVRRFVVSAMSVGALSPEAHQALTIGIQRAGGSANTGEGGEDPAWYAPGPDGKRHDARIKQVASARFGVTATYLARADQLEIKIAQGSKPGEGGQLPGRKATAYIAALRRGQPGQSYISPPPHHDIYSIEDLAQLIADLRAINPAARIGVKLVAGRGVGTIAAGVAKAGASYIHLSGHAGGTGASPLSSIKHVGAPWELGLAEVHQVLLRNDLRDRVALRTDGGLQTGRDLLIAALLGAEEFAFGTAALVAIGCDMARQCHLDTCPTGIATQREDLRAKFAGTPGRGRPLLHGDRRGPPARAGGGRRTVGRRDRRREPAAAARRADRPGGAGAGHRCRAVARARPPAAPTRPARDGASAMLRRPRWRSGSPRRSVARARSPRPACASPRRIGRSGPA